MMGYGHHSILIGISEIMGILNLYEIHRNPCQDANLIIFWPWHLRSNPFLLGNCEGFFLIDASRTKQYISVQIGLILSKTISRSLCDGSNLKHNLHCLFFNVTTVICGQTQLENSVVGDGRSLWGTVLVSTRGFCFVLVMCSCGDSSFLDDYGDLVIKEWIQSIWLMIQPSRNA